MFGKDRLSEQSLARTLQKVKHPYFEEDIWSLGFVQGLTIEGGDVRFTLALPTPADPAKDALLETCRRQIGRLHGVADLAIDVTAVVRGQRSEPGEIMPQVKNVIAVASGKGGVGKSTTSANLALALQKSGASVGLLDADVYGPSMPLMFKIRGQPRMGEGNRILPLEARGIKLMSMGFVSQGDTPAILRGPMVHNLLQQFLVQVDWGPMDYLVIDLPPGTGDAQLTLSQRAPLSGAVIVTTPQDVSLIDARKGLRMFQQVNVPVLGLVENMSYFICDACGKRHEIFRHGGGRRTADELDCPFLGEIPIDPSVAVGGDEGDPIVVKHPESAAARAYQTLASQVAIQLAVLAHRNNPEADGFHIKWESRFEV